MSNSFQAVSFRFHSPLYIVAGSAALSIPIERRTVTFSPEIISHEGFGCTGLANHGKINPRGQEHKCLSPLSPRREQH